MEQKYICPFCKGTGQVEKVEDDVPTGEYEECEECYKISEEDTSDDYRENNNL
jgi:hypothetical protein